MAQFVTFTDIDGLVTRINPDDVVSIYIKPSNPLVSVVRLNDSSTFLSSQSIATLQALFSPSEIVALDTPTLAALESITVQNPGGASAVNIQDGGNSITVDGVAFDTRPLNCATDSVTVCPGATPLQVVFAGTCGDIGISPVPVCFSLDFATDKVDVSGSVISVTIEPLTFAEDKVDVSGSTVTLSGPITTTIDFSYPEDSVHVSGDKGAFTLGVRNDAAAVLTNSNGDYSPFATDSAGRIGIADLGGSITIDGSVSIIGTVPVSGPLTDAQLRATPVPVSGTVTITDGSGPVTVDGTITANQGTSPWVVSGTVAVTQTTSPWVTSLDATTLAALESITVQNPGGASAVNIQDGGNSITVDGTVGISGTVAVTQSTTPWVTSISGSVAVTGPLTDAQLRATAVPVSGPLTDTQLRATPVPVTIEALTFAEDKIDVSGSSVSISGTVGVTQSTSPWVVSGTVIATSDFSYAEDVPHVSGDKGAFVLAVRNDAAAAFTNNNGDYSPVAVDSAGRVLTIGPLTDTQLRASAVPVTGPLTDTQLRATPVPISGTVTVTDGSGPLTVDGTVAATQSGAWTVSNNNGAGAAAVNIQDGGNSITVDGTVSISGTVGVTQSTSPWVVSNPALSVVGGGTEAAALRVTIANNSTGVLAVTDNGGSITVDGTVAATQSGSWSVTNLNGAGAAAVNIQDGGNSITVDGTVAATQSGAWSVTNLNGSGAAAVNIQDGGNSITVDGTVAVSGTVAVTQSTSPWIMSGTVVGTKTPADGAGNPTDAQDVEAFNMVFNGTTWDRTRAGSTLGSVLTALDAPSLAALETITVQNPGGASAVNIQDGGNSITVDGAVSISGTVAVTQSTTPWVVSQQPGTITNGTETAVSSSAVLILASNANRKKYIIQNTGAANIRVGTTGVTANTGARILPNGTLLLEMPNCPIQDIYAIREGAVDSIAFAEEVT